MAHLVKVHSALGDHFRHKVAEAEIVKKLWEPRPVLNECLTDNTKGRIASLYQYGYSIEEITGWFCLSKVQTRELIIAHGVEIRRGRRRYNITEAQWEAKKAEYHHSCAYCGRRMKNPHVEHIIPLAEGGKDDISNIVPACRRCNSSKGKRELFSWKSFRKLQLNLDQL